ncbi:MAG TPA: glycosyltransferase [Candidatus Krumholzibacteria bacterium]|nr:glycosyltransferase [Candidatus Krumholzibacteria bacterium]HPD72585.1 glycosyltransferase [Candidatus Krumholzibacteria bacterium]HRY40483.1 glycosyltransferase [Candidatus Krumholzibacteria bacterium]
MRLALFGPAPPLRGGIVAAQANLYRTLQARGHALHWTSFRRQYPDILFPGSAQEGPTATWLQCPSHRVFVPWDPLSWRAAARDLLAFAPDGVIARWWIPFFAPGFRDVLRRVRRRTRVVWVLDNVVPHERYPLGPWLTRRALRQGHGFIAQSEQVRRDLVALVPEIEAAAIRVVPHPLYDYGAPERPRPTVGEARRTLDVPAAARVILFFGFIKPYKGLVHLIDAAPRLRDRFGPDGVRILIVGDVYGDRQPYIDRIARSGAADVIRFHADYVPDEDVERWFVAADLVVLPYVSATQSGIVQIAWNYDRPVVTTRVGGLPEVVRDGQTGFLVPPGDPAALAEACIRFFDEGHAAAMAGAIGAEKVEYSWENQAKAIEDLVAGA